MRRVALVLVAAACGLLLVQAPAAAKCVVLPFDTAVRESEVVWWATVTGVQKVDVGDLSSRGLKVRIEDNLKGPGTVGETRVVLYHPCAMFLPTRLGLQARVGQTQLFMGNLAQDVLVAPAPIFKPQGLSPEQHYERALKDLTQSVSPLPLVAGGLPLWVIVAAVLAMVVVVVAAGIFIVARRRRTTTG